MGYLFLFPLGARRFLLRPAFLLVISLVLAACGGISGKSFEGNTPPSVISATINMPENTVKVITLSATDVDGDFLAYSILQYPNHGQLSLNGEVASYAPDSNFVGEDQFTFSANDGVVDSLQGIISFIIEDVEYKPVADDVVITLNEDVSNFAITLKGSSTDNKPLIYSIVDQASHASGVVTINDEGKAVYSVDANYVGDDSFTYKVNDGELDSNIADVNLTITAINDAPVAQNGSATVDTGGSVQITLRADDIDSSIQSYSVETNSQYGSVLITNNIALYTPDSGYTGVDSFTYRASDGSLSSEEATISIAIKTVATNNTVKILSLGDSITQAHFSQLSYRYPLWKKLIDVGVDFDFIGSQNQTYDGTRTWPAYRGHQFDQDHEGYKGWYADQVLNSADFHYDNPADIALIHLGTNDVLWSDDSGETVKNDIADIISRLRDTNPNIKILVAKIMPYDFNLRPRRVVYYDFIARLDRLASEMNQTSSPIIVVDMADIHDWFDGLHPNAAGEELMAQRWFDAMSAQGVF